MESTDKVLKKIIKYILRNLVETHPLFVLRYLGYDGYIHQAEIFYKLAIKDPIRALIADEIGLGKTIETLLLIRWGILKKKFNSKRILILVPRSIIGQWREEAKRFGLNSVSDINIFEKIINSSSEQNIIFLFKIDTAKRPEYESKLLNYGWDLIVVDEVHKLGLDTERLRLVKDLVEKNPQASIIFLSATPHKGDDENYLELLSLLDPINKGKIDENTREVFYDKVIDALIFRRSKRQINEVYENDKIFVDAIVEPIYIEPTDDEKIYIEELDKLTRDLVINCREKNLRRAVGLLAMIIDKRGLSSPYAGLKTFEKILSSIKSIDYGYVFSKDVVDKIEDYTEEEYISDVDPDTFIETYIDEGINKEIRKFMEKYVDSFTHLGALAKVTLSVDKKIEKLQEIIAEHLKKGEKVIVFTEFADTADYIYDKLSKSLDYEIKKISGRDLRDRGSDVIKEIKEWLREPGPRVLISTDVASEGLNLQFANIVINYELPWSLVKLEQRTGRVWRLGQHSDVKIYLLIMNHSFEEKIFNSLYRKIADSVKAGIIPSSLTILKIHEKDKDIDLPISGLVEFKDLTPYKLWMSYKERKEEGIKEIVNRSLKDLMSYSEKLKKLRLYSSDIPSYVLDYIKKRLKSISGFINKKEFHDLLCTMANLSGYPRCTEYIIDDMLKSSLNQIFPENLYLYCENINKLVLLLKACAKSSDREEEGVCWLFTYIAGEKEKITRYIDDFIDIIKNAGRCDLIGRSLSETILDRYRSKYEELIDKNEISHYLRENIIKNLLEEHFKYQKYISEKGLRSEDFVMKPKNIREIDLKIDPLITIFPKDFIEETINIVREEMSREIEESIVIGEITEEKLEIEKLGMQILERFLKDKYDLLYVGDIKAPFDYIAKDRVTGKTIFIELKTLRKLKYIIYTENEKEFGERILNKLPGDNEYWLFIVDLSNNVIRCYKNPFTRYGEEKLKLIDVREHKGRKYFVYEELNTIDDCAKI